LEKGPWIDQSAFRFAMGCKPPKIFIDLPFTIIWRPVTHGFMVDRLELFTYCQLFMETPALAQSPYDIRSDVRRLPAVRRHYSGAERCITNVLANPTSDVAEAESLEAPCELG
jgi:hypothetical protein